MRNFLPIKGPGGRALTPKEKVALCVLGVTLVLCVLTMVAGESAYSDTQARNPIFAVVAMLCRALGGGIVGLYAVVLVWSGLIYFKGERIADVAPVAGRMLAAFGVVVGISGALGIGSVPTAGALGSLVGGALGNTIGGTLGIGVLLALMLLGVHLSSQGAWGALREPSPIVAHGYSVSAPTLEASGGRVSSEPPLPDDGDPSPDERTNAVTLAMEEIERSHGVTIVDVERTDASEAESRPSIGEEVEAATPPAHETDEAEVQRGLREVSEALALEHARHDETDDADVPHPFTPAPSESVEAQAVEEVDEEAEAPEEAEEEDVEAEPTVYEPTYELIDRVPEETGFAPTSAATDEDEIELAAHAEVAAGEETEVEESEAEEDDADDPHARGGLLKRLKDRQQEDAELDASRRYASFDWRGRPLD